MRQLKSAPIVVSLFVTLMVALPTFADEQHEGSSALVARVVRGADLQLARQRSYSNADTGVGTYDCSWEWEIGAEWA